MEATPCHVQTRCGLRPSQASPRSVALSPFSSVLPHLWRCPGKRRPTVPRAVKATASAAPAPREGVGATVLVFRTLGLLNERPGDSDPVVRAAGGCTECACGHRKGAVASPASRRRLAKAAPKAAVPRGGEDQQRRADACRQCAQTQGLTADTAAMARPHLRRHRAHSRGWPRNPEGPRAS